MADIENHRAFLSGRDLIVYCASKQIKEFLIERGLQPMFKNVKANFYRRKRVDEMLDELDLEIQMMFRSGKVEEPIYDLNAIASE